MRHIKLLLLTLLVCGFWSCNQGGAIPSTSLTSPNEQIKIDFLLTAEGQPAYAVSFKGKTVVDTSTLGFDLRDMPALGQGMEIQAVDVSQFSETWGNALGRAARGHQQLQADDRLPQRDSSSQSTA